MRKLDKLVIGVISCGLVVYLIRGPCATFLANQNARIDQKEIKEANRSLPAYDHGSETLAWTELPEYVSEKHGFAVRFPEKPKVTDYGGTVHYEFGAETEQEATYTIFVTTYEKPRLTNEAIVADLNGYLQGRIKTFGATGKLVNSQEVLFLDHRALDYEYTKEVQGLKSYFKGVHFVVGKMSYTISMACTEGTKPSAYQRYQGFVRSFRLIKDY